MVKRKKKRESLVKYEIIPSWMQEMGVPWSQSNREGRGDFVGPTDLQTRMVMSMGGRSVGLPLIWRPWISLMNPWDLLLGGPR